MVTRHFDQVFGLFRAPRALQKGPFGPKRAQIGSKLKIVGLVGLLEFCITDLRGETSSSLNELQEGGGKVEQGPLGDLKLPKVGQYELLDFVDLAQLS